MIFEVKTKISSTKQGRSTITEYYNKMKGLWLELDYYHAIKMVCSEDATTLSQIFERHRIIEFLAGLNPEFDQVRIQVLDRDILPNLNEVFAIIRSEGNQRCAMLTEHSFEGLGLMISNKGGGVKYRKRIVQNRGSNPRGVHRIKREAKWSSNEEDMKVLRKGPKI